MSDYTLDARCPCCQAPLLASVTVIDAGGRRGEDYDIGLELAPAPELEHHALDAGAESCALCESPFADAQERRQCAQRRAQERIAAERGYPW